MVKNRFGWDCVRKSIKNRRSNDNLSWAVMNLMATTNGCLVTVTLLFHVDWKPDGIKRLRQTVKGT